MVCQFFVCNWFVLSNSFCTSPVCDTLGLQWWQLIHLRPLQQFVCLLFVLHVCTAQTSSVAHEPSELVVLKNPRHHITWSWHLGSSPSFPFLLSDKVELTSNGLENSRGGLARHTPPPPSPSGRTHVANSSNSSPSAGQDGVGLVTPAAPGPNATSSTEPASSSATTESTTESLPAG